MAQIKKQNRALQKPKKPREYWNTKQSVYPDYSPLQHLERSLRDLRPRSTARRIVEFGRWADLCCPALVPKHRDPGLVTLGGLPWIRPLYTLPSASSRDDVVRHLLWRYPTSHVLLEPFRTECAGDGARMVFACLEALRRRRRLAEISALLGQGAGFQQVKRLLPRRFTRNMLHRFLTGETADWCWAYIGAIASCFGASPRLIQAVVQCTQPHLDGRDNRLIRVVQWMCQQDIEPEQVVVCMDYLSAHDVELKGRTRQSVLRLANDWHQQLAARQQPVDTRPYEACGYGQQPIENPAWTFIELRSYMQLFWEGRSQHHCVASYAHRVKSGNSSIWSARFQHDRVLTVQVLNQKRKIIQARGSQNRRPTPVEQRVLEQWAAANGLLMGAT